MVLPCLYAERFQAQVLDVAGDADGDDGDLGLQFFAFEFDGDAGLRLRELVDLGRESELQTPLLEGLLRGLGDLLVLDGEHAVHHLDDGHFSA